MLILKTIIRITIIYIIIICFIPWLWMKIDKKLDIKVNFYTINTKNKIINQFLSIWESFKKWADNPTPKMRNSLNNESKYIKELENN